MVKKKSLTVLSQTQGFLMTNEGLLIPGRLLRTMGDKIAISFSPQLIVISPRLMSSPTDKPDRAVRRTRTGEDVKHKSVKPRRKTAAGVKKTGGRE